MRKSILCFLLSLVLLFNSGYKAHVEALSLVVIGSVTLGEALLYCACVVGTTVAVVENEKHFQEQQMETLQNSDIYEPYGEEMLQDFKNWCSNCPQYVDMTTRNIEDWLANVVEGTLDKGSEVWSAFKDYIVNLSNVQSEIDTFVPSTDLTLNFSQVQQALGKIDKVEFANALASVEPFLNTNTTSYYPDDYTTIYNNGVTKLVEIITKDGRSTLAFVSNAYATNPTLIGSYGLGDWSFTWVGNNKAVPLDVFNYLAYNSYPIVSCPNFGGCWSSGITKHADYTISINDCTQEQLLKLLVPAGDKNRTNYGFSAVVLASGVINGYWDFSISIPDWGIADDVVIDDSVKEVLERDGTLDNVDVWGYGDMTLDKDDVISIDWDNVTVGDMARPYVGGQTLAVDLVDGIDINTDTPIEDIPVLPVAIRDSYTIPKLETVFPFCIPFDLVKIFTLFKAEPDAPHFTWTFYFGIGELKPYTIEIDLDPFNSVAEIVRLLELIGFLVFLTLKTRDLIRG